MNKVLTMLLVAILVGCGGSGSSGNSSELDSDGTSDEALSDLPPSGPEQESDQESDSEQDLEQDSEQDSEPKNSPPTAYIEAAPEVVVGVNVRLSGELSFDPDGNAISYWWEIIQAPSYSEANLSSPDTVNTEFIADIPGTYRIGLVVRDGENTSEQVTADVNVQNLPSIKLPSEGRLFNAYVHPETIDVWLACTLPETIGADNAGLWRTEDRGETWELIAPDKCPNRIVFSKSNPEIVLADDGWGKSFGDGAYTYGVSYDSGITWQWEEVYGLSGNLLGEIRSITVDPNNSDEWWLASRATFDHGFYRTLDGGETWEKMTIDYESTWASSVVHSPASPDTVYFTVGHSNNREYALQRSTNNGDTIEPITEGMYISGQSGHGFGLQIDNLNEDLMLGSEGNLTIDGGETWEKIYSSGLLRDGSMFYVEYHSEPGIYESTDNGRNFVMKMPADLVRHSNWAPKLLVHNEEFLAFGVESEHPVILRFPRL